MINLLDETHTALTENGKTPDDVRFVRTYKAVGSWADFARFANFDYNNGYGLEVVNTTLRVVGDDWWLERASYDGSAWWEFKQRPERPKEGYPLRSDDLKEKW